MLSIKVTPAACRLFYIDICLRTRTSNSYDTTMHRGPQKWKCRCLIGLLGPCLFLTDLLVASSVIASKRVDDDARLPCLTASS